MCVCGVCTFVVVCVCKWGRGDGNDTTIREGCRYFLFTYLFAVSVSELFLFTYSSSRSVNVSNVMNVIWGWWGGGVQLYIWMYSNVLEE